MLDFTSALYLGMRHERDSLEPWPQFTTGKPVALEEPAEARAIARALADLQGTEAAVLAASTLHLAWDLFVFMAQTDSVEIFLDAGSYPIGRWGIERAACRGVPVRRFRHHDPDDLEQTLKRPARQGRRPLIVTDGFCPGCGRLAPLRAYLACAERNDGWLILDDTQALGVLGADPEQCMPYGYQGGGSLRHCDLQSPRALVFSSLAKAFGVPVAVLAGNRQIVSAFQQASETRVHCSPPSIAVLQAARHALAVNHRCGDALRTRLLSRVKHFRRGLRGVGIGAVAGLFPIQGLELGPGMDPIRLHEQLRAQNVEAVLQRRHGGPGARVTFLLTASHSIGDIDRATLALASATKANKRSAKPDRIRNLTSRLSSERKQQL